MTGQRSGDAIFGGRGVRGKILAIWSFVRTDDK